MNILMWCRQSKGHLYKASQLKADEATFSQSLLEVVQQLRPSTEEQARQSAALNQVPCSLPCRPSCHF